ncbi:MAG: OmpH family outer membrane protein [Kiritimatiellae bacterium]|nr:OmpH family outer membrane protein [Kiritimatiellia bacterium]
MKKAILAVSCMACWTVLSDMKIGTVNMVDLVKLHPSYETNKALLKSTDKDYKAKLDKLQEDIKAIADEGKKAQEDLANPMLSAAAKASAQKKLEGVQRRYIAARQDMEAEVRRYQGELADLEARLMKLQTDEIREKISVYAREHGFDMIIDSTMLAFSKPSLEVTDDILRVMKVDPEKRKTLKADAKAK